MFDCRPPGQCFYSSHSNYDIIYLEEMSVNQSLRNMVGLNKHCDSNNLCDGAKTICSDGVCICQSGWIAKKGSCVQSVCKSPELHSNVMILPLVWPFMTNMNCRALQRSIEEMRQNRRHHYHMIINKVN
ncbi:unnamed protein product [Heterobilharzia americana]|nr:unnamed protein product [Heterobilharzia americana]